ncbi:ArnT family glycosyltransferase [Nitratireductor soli]|uniref:ArnT family glycosyltransferase n=1 Tax=Nitratireductor soli TaxID=1670619 RepID=UPI00065E71F0|nr:glycosyltransferase family 39 protein [Nitratireductor soli]
MRDTLKKFRASHVILLLIAAILAARLADMALLPLMDTTEARYGEMARKMALLGDWITPWADDGVPFWGKPPLAFWITALSFRLFGVSEFTARLPHFLCALLIGAMVWDLARRQYGARAALLSASVLTGSALFLVSSGAVMTDTALVLGTTGAMYGFWLALNDPSLALRQRGAWVFFTGIAIGLLAKGPLTFVLAGLPLFIWVTLARKWKETFQNLPWILGALFVAALVLPWYILAEEKTPGFLDYFIVGEHWSRFMVPGWKGDLYGTAHRYPPGTIWLFSLLALLPWSISLFVGAWQSRGETPSSEKPADASWTRYLLPWALLPLIFFTAARNIIWTYALPSLPAAALLLGGWMAQRSRKSEIWAIVGLSIVICLVAGAGIGAALFPNLLDRSTAKSVAQAYMRYKYEQDQPLFFVTHRPFSASFYTLDQARLVNAMGDIAANLASPGGYLAVPVSFMAKFVKPDDLEIEYDLGRFGEYELLHLHRITNPHDGERTPLAPAD